MVTLRILASAIFACTMTQPCLNYSPPKGPGERAPPKSLKFPGPPAAHVALAPCTASCPTALIVANTSRLQLARSSDSRGFEQPPALSLSSSPRLHAACVLPLRNPGLNPLIAPTLSPRPPSCPLAALRPDHSAAHFGPVYCFPAHGSRRPRSRALPALIGRGISHPRG